MTGGNLMSYEFPCLPTVDSEKTTALKLDIGNSSSSRLSIQFDSDSYSPLSIPEQQSSAETNSFLKLKSAQNYVVCSKRMKYALQEIEMTPKTDEATTISTPDHQEDEHKLKSAQNYAFYSRSMRYALENALMEPGIDEATTSSTPDRQEDELNLAPKKRSTACVPHCLPEKRQRRTSESDSVEVVNLLFKCAEALDDGNISDFEVLENKISDHVSIEGEPIQRLGAYVLGGLQARHKNSGSKIYRVLRCRQPESKELQSYMSNLHNVCPYIKFGYMAANGAIAEAVRDDNRIHIIDFQIAQGNQWETLIMALAVHPRGPPHVRITGIEDPFNRSARSDDLQLVGNKLSDLSKMHKIPLEFHPLSVYAPEVTMEMLDIRPGEALAVNFTLQLHQTPDESVDVNNPRDGLLRMVKGMSPKVITLVEQESDTNTTPFLVRFEETMNYYSAMFESIDAIFSRKDKDRINIEKNCLAKDIVSIIACEGEERIERHEVLEKWRSRFIMAGFSPFPLNSHVISVIRKLLGRYSEKYTLMESDGALLLGWRNKNLISASAWH
uniref:Chitin-inducible gibberellin-responsive protein 1-like isoform X4 n=1 Tax=Cymbidium sinense TaxID=112615 RepID=A0A515HGK0_9ASPA|nr:chitin-inducible gibberellin-responsive protein 1-like isoform X4 [Cymbidium sinense]